MQCNFTINPNHPNYSLTCFLLPTPSLWLSMYKLISDGGEMKLNQSACSKTFTRDGGPYVSFCDLRELHKSHSQQIIVFFSLSFSKKGFFFFCFPDPRLARSHEKVSACASDTIKQPQKKWQCSDQHHIVTLMFFVVLWESCSCTCSWPFVETI